MLCLGPRFADMTSYISSLTLPASVFTQPAAAILLPVALGTTVGFMMQRRGFRCGEMTSCRVLTCSSDRYPKDISRVEAATLSPSPADIRAGVDRALWFDGVLGLPCLDHRNSIFQPRDHRVDQGTQ